MLTDKQRARLERALATDPTARRVSPPPAEQLLDWLEWRALRVCGVRRSSDEETSEALIEKAESTRDWLASLPDDDSWANFDELGSWTKRHRSSIQEDVQRCDRAIASAKWTARARRAHEAGAASAMVFVAAVFAAVMAESAPPGKSERHGRHDLVRLRNQAANALKRKKKKSDEQERKLVDKALEVRRKSPALKANSVAGVIHRSGEFALSRKRIYEIIRPHLQA